MTYTDLKTPHGTYKVDHIKRNTYTNGRTCLTLVDTSEGYPEPIMVATVNLPDENLEKDESAIKNYSEDEGVLDWLVENGIASAPVRYTGSGFVQIPIVKLLM